MLQSVDFFYARILGINNNILFIVYYKNITLAISDNPDIHQLNTMNSMFSTALFFKRLMATTLTFATSE